MSGILLPKYWYRQSSESKVDSYIPLGSQSLKFESWTLKSDLKNKYSNQIFTLKSSIFKVQTLISQLSDEWNIGRLETALKNVQD